MKTLIRNATVCSILPFLCFVGCRCSSHEHKRDASVNMFEIEGVQTIANGSKRLNDDELIAALNKHEFRNSGVNKSAVVVVSDAASVLRLVLLIEKLFESGYPEIRVQLKSNSKVSTVLEAPLSDGNKLHKQYILSNNLNKMQWKGSAEGIYWIKGILDEEKLKVNGILMDASMVRDEFASMRGIQKMRVVKIELGDQKQKAKELLILMSNLQGLGLKTMLMTNE